MITVPKIEMHLAHACNLRCQGCNHYSNYSFSGLVPQSVGGKWLRDWSSRLAPLRLSFLGGEPLLNREVPDYLRLARQLWPRAWTRLVSNGLLLDRWGDDLWNALAETETTLTISIHSRDPQYVARLSVILDLARARAEQHGFALEGRNSVDGWYRPYIGHGPEMEPYNDGDPARSWRVCPCKHCVTLQDNLLWKCPPLAHLRRVADRFGLGKRPSWKVPLAYRPLSLDASEEEICRFVGRGPEPACGMCPGRPEYFKKSIY